MITKDRIEILSWISNLRNDVISHAGFSFPVIDNKVINLESNLIEAVVDEYNAVVEEV